MAGDLEVESVRTEDGREVACAFGARNAFWFLVKDERDDKPRGPFESIGEAATAALHQVQCMRIADAWGDGEWAMMLDT